MPLSREDDFQKNMSIFSLFTPKLPPLRMIVVKFTLYKCYIPHLVKIGLHENFAPIACNHLRKIIFCRLTCINTPVKCQQILNIFVPCIWNPCTVYEQISVVEMLLHVTICHANSAPLLTPLHSRSFNEWPLRTYQRGKPKCHFLQEVHVLSSNRTALFSDVPMPISTKAQDLKKADNCSGCQASFTACSHSQGWFKSCKTWCPIPSNTRVYHCSSHCTELGRI